MRSLLGFVLLLLAPLLALAAGDTYLLGVGRGDITGTTVEVPFMGYASGSRVPRHSAADGRSV